MSHFSYLEFYKGKKGKQKRTQHYWKFVANGHILADSAEGYNNLQDAKDAWKRIADAVTNSEYEVRESL